MTVELAAPRPQPDGVAIDAQVGSYGLVSGHWGATYTTALGNRVLPNLTGAWGLNERRVAAMRRHYQVSACLLVLTLPLLRADSNIECEDDDVREFVEGAWDHIRLDVMRSSARSLWAGYSPNVLVWEVDPDLGGLVVTKLRDLEPFTCEPLVDDRGSYAGFIQNRNSYRGDELKIEDPRQTLWLVEGMESGNLRGRSLLEAALDPWMDGEGVRVFHTRYLERFGEPVVKVRVPPGKVIANQLEIEAAVIAGTPEAELPEPIFVDNIRRGQLMGESLRHHSVVTLPSDRSVSADGKDIGYSWDIDYLESSRNGGADFREALDRFDRSMARALFVPDLTFTNTDTGAYALGREHRSIFDASVEGRLDDYSRQITRHLIARLVAFNFGPNAPRAELVFGGITDTDRTELWELATELVRGNRLSPDIEALGARLGIPLAQPDEDGAPTAEGTELAASPFANVGLPALISAGIISAQEARDQLGFTGDVPEPAAAPAPAILPDDIAARAAIRAALGLPRERVELAAPPADVAGVPDYRLPQSYDPPSSRRAMTTRERRVPFAKVEAALNTAEREAIDSLADILEAQRGKVLRQVAGIMGKGTQAEVIAAIRTLDLGAPTREAAVWDGLSRSVWALGLDSVRAELTAYAAQIPDGLGPEARALAATYAQTSAERHLSNLSTELRLSMANAVTSGVTRAGVEGIVSDLYDRELRSEGRPLRLTTRMLSSKALNSGRRDAIERGGIPLRGAQYSALLDRRTCALCERLDETVIAIESTDLQRFTPPVHHNCRCVWVWITRDELDFTPTWQTPSVSDVDRYGGLVF